MRQILPVKTIAAAGSIDDFGKLPAFSWLRIHHRSPQNSNPLLVSLGDPIFAAQPGPVFETVFPGERRIRNIGHADRGDAVGRELHLYNADPNNAASFIIEIADHPIVDLGGVDGNRLWLDGLGVWRAAAGTPHPYHPGGAYQEVAIPQDLSAFSAPASGATASVTITNPKTANQQLITITGITAGLAQGGTPSAGQANALTITGSVGGQYTSEPLSVPNTAFAVDRLVYRGQQLVTGNGNQAAANVNENYTVTFSVAGQTGLFQRINVYYHFGA